MNLSQAHRELIKLTKTREATPEPYPAELTDLHRQLLKASKADIIIWLDNELTLDYDNWSIQLLTDWHDFLMLKDDPSTEAEWRNEPKRGFYYIDPAKGKQLTDIKYRHNWFNWDGRGLPPEMRE